MLIITQKNDAKSSLDESMIPAINIIFLLLIFFMIVGHIEARNDQLLVPISSSQENVADIRFEIQILANGQKLIDGELVQGSLLQALKVQNLAPNTIVICRIHRELPVTALDPVLAAARSLGIEQLQIVTDQQS